MQNILNIKRAFTVAALLGSIAIANIPGPSTVLLVENGSERLQLRHLGRAVQLFEGFEGFLSKRRRRCRRGHEKPEQQSDKTRLA